MARPLRDIGCGPTILRAQDRRAALTKPASDCDNGRMWDPGETTYLNDRIEVVVGDITTLAVDLIVNAANGALCGGGGVDGDIHDAAGPELLAECRRLGGARPGEVKLTKGYRLPARFIAHAVGPVWRGGDHDEDETLALCYRGALELAVAGGLSTVAFPTISTGAYRFPIPRAARIALVTVRDFLLAEQAISKVTFCCFSESDAKAYRRVALELFAKPQANGGRPPIT